MRSRVPGGRRAYVMLLAAYVLLAACANDATVTAQRSDQIPAGAPTTEPAPPASTDAPESPPDSGDDPPTTAPSPSIAPDEVDRAAIDFGPNKPPRAYDDFLLAVITDLNTWWNEQYPAIYGDTFQPLSGGVHAAYPERPDDLPGCGEPRTTYPEVQEFVAFYCGVGDYIIYDDGNDGLLATLADRYGPAAIGIVFAHEFGHAIQLRAGELDRNLPTIYTEQQSDCFAGAWAARVSHEESAIVGFSDADVRSGLIAMTEVSDPVGLNQFVPGGHGSAFDRVGAFQVGFNDGVGRCSGILDDPLPLVPNEFNSLDDQQTGGDAAFGYGTDQLLNFIPADLNLYWDGDVKAHAGGLGSLTLVNATTSSEVDCDDPTGNFERGAVYCASSATVYLNEPRAQEVYQAVGDFSVGYLIGTAWSEAVQDALGAGLTGEPRALLDDCLTGAWVKTTIPVDGYLPTPRGAERTVTVSPGDLDEAIQTVILLSDAASSDNVFGSAFEKIDAFRHGVLGGLDVCLQDL